MPIGLPRSHVTGLPDWVASAHGRAAGRRGVSYNGQLACCCPLFLVYQWHMRGEEEEQWQKRRKDKCKKNLKNGPFCCVSSPGR